MIFLNRVADVWSLKLKKNDILNCDEKKLKADFSMK
jgi:hypothetical protein